MSRVSVVMPFYNAAHHLEGALRNLCEQTFTDFELVIVDDGSGDNGFEHATQLTRDLPFPVHLTRLEQNCGPATARNRGLALARAPLVAFFDVDDRWLPAKLARQVEAMDKDPCLTILGCQATWYTADGEPLGPLIRWVSPDSPELWKHLLWNSFIATPCVMLRKAAIPGPAFDDQFDIGEDRDLWIRMAAAGKVSFVDEPLVSIHKSSGSHMDRRAIVSGQDTLRVLRLNIGRHGEQLSKKDKRQALGRAHFDLGEILAVCPGSYLRGVAHLAIAMAYGFRPAQCMRHAILSMPALRNMRVRPISRGTAAHQAQLAPAAKQAIS